VQAVQAVQAVQESVQAVQAVQTAPKIKVQIHQSKRGSHKINKIGNNSTG
jgi:hypothetical protein